VKGRVVQGSGAPAALATRITFHAGELLPIRRDSTRPRTATAYSRYTNAPQVFGCVQRPAVFVLDGNPVTARCSTFRPDLPSTRSKCVRRCARTVKGRAAPQFYYIFVYGHSGPLDHESGPNGDFVQELPVGEYHASATRGWELPDDSKGT